MGGLTFYMPFVKVQFIATIMTFIILGGRSVATCCQKLNERLEETNCACEPLK